MKKYKVIIDRKKCMGCSICSSFSGNKIKMNEKDGLIDIKNFKKENNLLFGEISEKELDDFIRAANVCPQFIIKIK